MPATSDAVASDAMRGSFWGPASWYAASMVNVATRLLWAQVTPVVGWKSMQLPAVVPFCSAALPMEARHSVTAVPCTWKRCPVTLRLGLGEPKLPLTDVGGGAPGEARWYPPMMMKSVGFDGSLNAMR